jgi:hypothetical protein
MFFTPGNIDGVTLKMYTDSQYESLTGVSVGVLGFNQNWNTVNLSETLHVKFDYIHIHPQVLKLLQAD